MSVLQKKSQTKRRPRLFGVGKEREYFVENLSMLVASSTPILEAVRSIQVEMRSRSMKKVLDLLLSDIDAGASLSTALSNTGLFKDYTISFIRIGEQSGRLPENLKLIAAQEKKSRIFRSRIRSAMMYPVFVLTLTLLIGVGIAWFILPKLAQVFAELKVDLPLVTQLLIAAGEYLSENGEVALLVFLGGLVAVLYLLFFCPKTKAAGQFLLFAMPGVKGLIKEVEIARFGYLTGTLLGAGLSPTEALHAVRDATTFYQYRRLYGRLAEQITEGNSFQQSFKTDKKIKKLIPTPIQQLIIAAEQSGNLPNTLLDISQNYEERTEQTTKNLTIILEPVLLVVVWLGVMGVALAVILPIYSLIGGLNSGPQAPPPAPTVVEVTEEVAEKVSAPSQETEVRVRVIETGVGYLNVRAEPTTAAAIVEVVYPGDTFVFWGEREGWYEIALPCATDQTENEVCAVERGWASAKYLELYETTNDDS